jgi:GNAT superfamily N-acetyltransferase
VAESRPKLATYPQSETINGRTVSYRLMTAEDKSAVLKFARTLPEADLMFLRIGITKPEVIDEWVHNIEVGLTVTVLAKDDRQVIGYVSLHHNTMMWTRLRVMVGPDWRHKGLGRRLVGQIFRLASEKGLVRIHVQFPANQPRVRSLFDRLGFLPEALMSDWIMSRDGAMHDLLIMSRAVDEYSG